MTSHPDSTHPKRKDRAGFRVRAFATALVTTWIMGQLQAQAEAPQPPRPMRVFEAGQNGVHTYRIPAVAVTKKGTVLAFCEARHASTSDSGDIDLVMRRSLDGGVTWGEIQTIADDADKTCGNPCPIVERKTGKIILLITKNNGNEREAQIMKGEAAPRTIWILTSDDDGLTWSEATEISGQVRKPDWRWYATGPGHGIQLASGRLVAPCDHSTGPGPDEMHSHIIFSDDAGATWQIGGDVGGRTDESIVVELPDGTLHLNMRNRRDTHRRAISTSGDQGKSWTPVCEDLALIEPVCQASILRLNANTAGAKSWVVFSNPASTRRENMTIKASFDNCTTWPVARQLWPGPAAYSDLVELPAGNVGCLFECGAAGPYEGISFSIVPAQSLAHTPDH